MYDTCELQARFVSCRLTLHGPKCLLKSLNIAFVKFLSFYMSPRAGTRRDEGLLLLRFQPSIVPKGYCVVNFCFWFLSPWKNTWKAWTCYPLSLHQIEFDSRVGCEAGMETWILQVSPAFVASKICGDLQYFFLLGSIVNESMQPNATYLVCQRSGCYRLEEGSCALCVLVWWNRCCFGDPGCRVALGFSKRL